MGRTAKHNWRKLFLEYFQGRYKSMAAFAKAKGLPVRPVQREFKKLQDEAANSEQNTLKKTTINDHNNGAEKRKRPKNDHKLHPWEYLKQQFLDWPEDKLQAYLLTIEERLAELKEIPFEEMSQDEIKELGKLRRERRAILSDPEPERICAAHNRDGSPCGNPAERGKRVCWNHGGAPGNGTPKGSRNAERHGFYTKIMPDDPEIMSIIEAIDGKGPTDILWDQIVLQYAAIARAQRIMYVKDREEMIKELKKTKSQREFNQKYDPSDPDSEPLSEVFREEEYEFQFAWDRHATFLTAQSKAMTTLEKLIARYEAMATDEQKLKVAKLKQDMEISRERLELEKRKVEQGGDGDEKEIYIDTTIPGIDEDEEGNQDD